MEMKIRSVFLLGNVKGRDHFEELGIDNKIMLD